MTVATHSSHENTDQLTVLQGTWEHFKLIQRGCEQNPGVRLSFYKAAIEILMPGREHEIFAEVIGHLVMTFLTLKGIFFVPTGAMDQSIDGQVSTRADKSFCLGSSKSIPDLAIEIVFTSGGVSKLARYAALGVPEVWFWEDGTLALYHWHEGGYEPIAASELEELKELDISHLKRCIMLAETDSAAAIRTFMQGM